MFSGERGFMLRLREALEVSWDTDTSYMSAYQAGNPALGQCYPTCRVVQYYYPKTEIIRGIVRTGGQHDDVHSWNGLRSGDDWYHIDMSWQQFPAGAKVTEFSMLDRDDLNDSLSTATRVSLLLKRVREYLGGYG